MSLVAWSVTCVLGSGSFNEAFDDVNLLQAKLSQITASETVQSTFKGMSSGGKVGKGDDGCLNLGESGKGGQTGKGKGGRGDACQQCSAAEAFCTSVVGYVSNCSAYWQNHPDSTYSQAFCAVQKAMQTYQSERKVLKHHYDDAVALRGACKKLVRAAEWGPTGYSRTCPSADQVTTACATPSIDNIEHLKMATFCDELELMCDGWAMWFIEAAGRQDAASLLEDGDRYSCKLFAAYNAWAWAEAPGGCEGGTPVMSDFVSPTGQSNVTEMNDTEWIDEEEEVDTTDAAFNVVRGKRVFNSTVQWMLLDLQLGCEDSPDHSDGSTREPLKSFSISGTQEQKRQKCFQKCQQIKWCMSIDVGLVNDSTCNLFDWDCETPTKSGRESWRLHRGDSGVSKTWGGRLGCDQPGYHIVNGSAWKWDCPEYLSEYTDSHHGCLLPEGPLARCVCNANSDCGGVTTVYEPGFRQEYGTKKKLVGVMGGDSTVAYTCQKVPHTVPGCSASEAAPGTKAEEYRGCQDTTVSGKACAPWEDNKYDSIDNEKSQMGYGADFNYCRNPGGTRDTIWCCTTASCGRGDKEYCTPKAAPQLLEAAAQDKVRVKAVSDELRARASSGVTVSAILDRTVSRKGCVLVR